MNSAWKSPIRDARVTSAATIAGSYIAGGMIPLSPYILLSNAVHGLAYSAVVTLAALAFSGI